MTIYTPQHDKKFRLPRKAKKAAKRRFSMRGVHALMNHKVNPYAKWGDKVEVPQ